MAMCRLFKKKQRPHYRTMGTGFGRYFWNTGNGKGLVVRHVAWSWADFIHLNHLRVG